MKLDMVVKNINVYNAFYKKFIKRDVYIKNGKFLHVGNELIENLQCDNIVDGNNNYMIPGLIDIHMHIESSMTTPNQFADAIVRHGVTTIVSDPHEIANVFGLEGIRAMIESNTQDMVDIFYGIPSSVPSTSIELETTGGEIGVEEVKELINNKYVKCLGEVMQFRDLIDDENSKINNIIRYIKDNSQHILIEGHCPKISGLELSLFIYNGVNSDHTDQSLDLIKEKIEKGMFLELQGKTLKKEYIDFIIENNLYEHFCFVTDDVMSDKLVHGHLNLLIKKAVDLGISIEDAIYMATYTPARRMLMHDRGSIAPGKIADFLIIENLDEFNIKSVYKNGKKVNCQNNIYTDMKSEFPDHFYKSVKVNKLRIDDFEVNADNKNKVKCRVMNVKPESTSTEELIVELEVENNKLSWEKSNLNLVTVIDRYSGKEDKAFGFVTGTVIREGAVATTYAHDHHNLMVMGRNKEDMAVAANWVIENQGGYCVVKDGKVLAGLELPIGGILTDESIDVSANKLSAVRKAMNELGYIHNNEIMSFSVLSLPVSPDLKISDKGLINVYEKKLVSLFI